MAMESYEFTGKTVDEAIADGLRTLKVTADQVEIEVLNKGSRGIFGLGSEPAQVRLSIRTAPPPPPSTAVENTEDIVPPPPEPAADLVEPEPSESAPAEVVEILDESTVTEPEPPGGDADEEAGTLTEAEIETIAVDLLTETVRLMGFQATVNAAWRDGNDHLSEHAERYLLLDLQGGDLGALIGRRGETLESLQYLLRLMVNQRLRRWFTIVVDVEGYKERRVHQLQQLALRTATQVATTGRAVALEPMPPNERRIIHIALRDHEGIYTESSGEGERRKVHIIAKN
jgi:spoIIIJ-associated protein